MSIKYRGRISFFEGGESLPLENEMESDQIYMTPDIKDGKIILDGNIGEVLHGVNVNNQSVFFFGRNKWSDNAFFLANPLRGGISTRASMEQSSEIERLDYELLEPCIIRIRPKNPEQLIDHFILYFDRRWGTFATRIFVDGVEYSNRGFSFIYLQEEKKSEFVVIITHSNTAGTPVVVLGALTGLEKYLDRNNTLSIENQLRKVYDETAVAEFGIITQEGSVNMIDTTGEVQSLQKYRLLTNKYPLTLEISDLEGNWRTMGSYKSLFKYNFGNQNVPVELTGEADMWNGIIFGGIRLRQNVVLYDLLIELITYTNNEYSITPEAEATLRNINVKYCYLDNSMVYEAINKTLVCGMCILFEDQMGHVLIDMKYNPSINAKPLYRINSGHLLTKPTGGYSNVVDVVEYEDTYLNFFNKQQQSIEISTDRVFKGETNGIYRLRTLTDINNNQWVIGTFESKFYQVGIVDVSVNAKSAELTYDSTRVSINLYVEDELVFTERVYNAPNVIGLAAINTTNPVEELNQYMFAVKVTSFNSFFIVKYIHNSDIRGFDTFTQKRTFGAGTNLHSSAKNELFNIGTTYGEKSINEWQSEEIIKNETGKQGLRIEIPKINYWAYSAGGYGERIEESKIDGDNGQFFKCGDVVYMWDNSTNLPYIEHENGLLKRFEVVNVNLMRNSNTYISMIIREV